MHRKTVGMHSQALDMHREGVRRHRRSGMMHGRAVGDHRSVKSFARRVCVFEFTVSSSSRVTHPGTAAAPTPVPLADTQPIRIP
ncbi:MAG: hypothetical protein ACTHLZ_07150 [Tepidisphaeraceae bacterium]